MSNHPDASARIRHFLLDHPGQHCEACLTKGTGLDAQAVKAVFKPARDTPYSFMPERCRDCGRRAICVAYVGESEATVVRQAAAAVMSTRH